MGEMDYYVVRICGDEKPILSFWAENKEDAMKYIASGIQGLNGIKITVTTKKDAQVKDENYIVQPAGVIRAE